MPRGDRIHKLILDLGGRKRWGEIEAGVEGATKWTHELWGGLVHVETEFRGPYDGHMWKRGHFFARRQNFAHLLSVVGHLYPDYGTDERLRVVPVVSAKAHRADGFWLRGTSCASGFSLAYCSRLLDPAAWDLGLGYLTHGEWRPLVDHLLETDPKFGPRWEAYQARRAKA